MCAHLPSCVATMNRCLFMVQYLCIHQLADFCLEQNSRLLPEKKCSYLLGLFIEPVRNVWRKMQLRKLSLAKQQIQELHCFFFVQISGILKRGLPILSLTILHVFLPSSFQSAVGQKRYLAATNCPSFPVKKDWSSVISLIGKLLLWEC